MMGDEILANATLTNKTRKKPFIFEGFQMDESEPAVVMDVGSSMTKVGFAGEEAPHAVFPCVVGRFVGICVSIGMGMKDYYVSDEAMAKRGTLMLKHPTQEGIVINWDDMEKVYHQCFYNELCVAPEERDVLLTEKVWNTVSNREKATQIMMETFNARGFSLVPDDVLALYHSGRTTGVAVGCGEDTVQVTPIYEGHWMQQGASHNWPGWQAGRMLTHLMMKQLNTKGYSFTTTAEREIVRDIKEKLCYVAGDFGAEMSLDEKELERSYELPDGQMISVGRERFRVAEYLLDPRPMAWRAVVRLLCDDPGSPFHRMPKDVVRLIVKQAREEGLVCRVESAIEACPEEVRGEMWRNVVLHGGSTLFPGLAERLQTELGHRVPQGLAARVIAPPERKYSAWIGGSILASLSTFQECLISQQEYYETGPTVVARKCLF